MDYIHVSLPSSRVLDYRAQCERILASHRVIVREWSLWARPEFFSFLVVDEDDGDAKATDAMADAVDKVLMLAQDMGGTMEYCHGVGVKLAHLMDRELGAGRWDGRATQAEEGPRSRWDPESRQAGRLIGWIYSPRTTTLLPTPAPRVFPALPRDSETSR